MALIPSALALAAVLSGVSAAYPAADTPANKLIVKFGSHFEFPRTVDEARRSSWTQVQDRTNIDKTKLFCLQDDTSACLLFDLKDSVAGMQISLDALEIAATNVPQDLSQQCQWFRHTMLGRDLWSTIVYFVSKEVLKQGGRTMTKDTPTAPKGIRILQSGTSSQDIPLEQTYATSLGFTEQNCFPGMGKHFFAGLNRTAKCETLSPYFLLYGTSTKSLLGFGVRQWGKLSNHRSSTNLFEKASVLFIMLINSNRPQCLTDWVHKYTLNTLHVYFVDSPGKIGCWF